MTSRMRVIVPAADMIWIVDQFEPRPSLRNGHWMTLYSWGNPRYFPELPPPVRRFFDVAPDARVVAECHWQARPWERPTLLALHGLNGSSGAHYMRGIAAKAFARGFNVVRLNQRNCGDTEHLAAGLFHSGLTADAAHVVHELTHVDGLSAIGVAGYSLGGNLALKLAGEYGPNPPRSLVGRRGGVADHRDRGMRARARAPGERAVSVEFRQGPETAHAPQGSAVSRTLRSHAAERDTNRSRVRRPFTRRRISVSRRRGLLLPRQRHARRGSHPRAGVDHHSGRRSIRPRLSRSTIRASPAIPASTSACVRTAATAASSGRALAMTTAIGPNHRSSSSSRGGREGLERQDRLEGKPSLPAFPAHPAIPA